MAGRRRSLDELPLFASDAEIAGALWGKISKADYKSKFAILERQNFPKVDPMMGGRYVPAVRAHFNSRYGIGSSQAPLKPDQFETW